MFNTELYKLIKNINGDTFIIGDTHLNHTNILKFEPIRAEMMNKAGFEDHDEWIIHNWNSVVGENDVVLHIGDFAFKNVIKFKGCLNGKKILILGNHDRKHLDTYGEVFDHILRGSLNLFNDKVYVAESTDELFSTLVIPYENEMLLISHYPATNQEKKYYTLSEEDKNTMNPGKVINRQLMVDRISEIMTLADENNITLNIHGHTHSKNVIDEDVMYGFINCSLENIDFKPMRLRDIMKKNKL